MATDMSVQEIRTQIDSIDRQLVALMNQRATFASQIGKLKSQSNGDFHVPSRERQVQERVAQYNQGPLPSEALHGIFRELMSACLALESPLKVAYLGPKATFSHLATMQQFGLSAQLEPQRSIPAVFEQVEKGKALYGIVPVENSTEGVVTHTLDMFVDSSLKICAEIILDIHHDLLSRTGRLEDIRKVYSHPQPLAQCRNWLEENLPGVPVVDVASTAVAAQIVSDDYAAAVIASELAASMYDLKVVRSRIEDQVNNVTRFLVISKKAAEPTGNDKTSVMFSVRDEPGILYRMLEPFARRGVNLSKIESRPVKTKAWEYIFFLDMVGHTDNPEVTAAIEDLKQFCQFLKVLGSYPKARS